MQSSGESARPVYIHIYIIFRKITTKMATSDDLYEKAVLKRALEKWSVSVMIGPSWLAIILSDGCLWIRWWNSRFHKSRKYLYRLSNCQLLNRSLNHGITVQFERFQILTAVEIVVVKRKGSNAMWNIVSEEDTASIFRVHTALLLKRQTSSRV
jgi:hypothetical protein